MTDRRKWPAAEIELVPVEALVAFAGNARTHGDAQIVTIADLMLRFGFTMPILRDERGTIIAGHARLKAALLDQSRGRAELAKVPVVTATGWTDEERRAYVIADNQSALLAGWNFGVLAREVQALAGSGFDVTMLGFGESELRKLTGYTNGLVDPDLAPALTRATVSKTGDLWLLGSHRLLCGDSTNAGAVERLLDGCTPHLMVTDPPYGVNYDPAWRSRAGVNKSQAKMGPVANDDRADWTPAWQLFLGDVAYVWHGGLQSATVEASLRRAGFAVRSQIIWVKERFALGRSDYHWRHEPAWYAVREGKSGHWASNRKQDTVWNIPAREDDGHGHSTQKPVECMRRPIENNSVVGDKIYDPFLGSGTTVIAAEQCERVCYGLEIDPRYIDVIIKRWQAFTGKQASLSDVGLTFEQAEQERSQKSHGRERTKTKADRVAGSGRQQGKARASTK